MKSMSSYELRFIALSMFVSIMKFDLFHLVLLILIFISACNSCVAMPC